jgi:transposase
MARFEKNSLEQGEFLAINIGEQFDENSRESILKDFIKNRIKLEDYSALYKNDHCGRKIKNPQDVICAILYGYITGNRSSRKIEDLLKKHIGFMYVSNRLKIDHSIICEFKLENQNKIKELFSRLLCILNEIGAIDWDIVVGDGTKIKASASKQKNLGKKKTLKMLETYKKMAEKIIQRDLELEEAFKDGKLIEERYEADKKRVSRLKKSYESILQKIDKYQKEIKDGKISEDEIINLTDPESKLMPGSTKNIFIQGYNSAMMISNNDIILDYEAITEAEKKKTQIMVKRVEDKKAELNVKTESKYLFDNGFQDMEKTVEMEEKGLDLYIDIKERDFSKESQKHTHFKVENENGKYFLNCVGKRKMKGYYDKNHRKYSFSFSRKGCVECTYYRECYKNIKQENQKKTVLYSDFELTRRDKIDRYLNKINSEAGQKIYRKRIGKEHVFSNIRTQKGYLQTVYRGRIKVNMELCWVSLSQNFTKYAQYMSK